MTWNLVLHRSYGLIEFQDFERMRANGMTYKNTMFLRIGAIDAPLVFHEMVHVVQWNEIGAEDFLLTYGMGLCAWGYDASPLEVMAYNLEVMYRNNCLPTDTEGAIRTLTRHILSNPMAQPSLGLLFD